MSLQKYTARVSEKRVFNHKYIILHIELVEPNRLEFQAGQYLLLDIPNTDQKKHYSIASMPEMNHAVELLIDISPAGAGSMYLDNLEIGQEVEFMAPLGAFTHQPKEEEKELFFVATGSGISPLRSMILDLLITKGDKRPIHLYWGMRHAEDLFWEEDFYQLTKDHDNFTLDIILSSPPDDWHLSKGYVTDLLDGYIEDYADKGYYICGSTAMIEDVRKLLIDKKVDEHMMHWEKFY